MSSEICIRSPRAWKIVRPKIVEPFTKVGAGAEIIMLILLSHKTVILLCIIAPLEVIESIVLASLFCLLNIIDHRSAKP